MKKYICFTLLAAALLAAGCKKFLDEKPDAKLDIPSSLADFQALLDRYPVMNTADASAGETSADNYYLFTADYLSLPITTFQNMYTWQKDNVFAPQNNDWFSCYRPVFSANTILEGLKNLSVTAQTRNDYNNVKGQALFVRGKAFLMAASIWAVAYDPASAQALPGIPIRLGADFNQRSVRSTLGESYNQLVSDLAGAAALLPVKALTPERASKPGAFAMLARAYLQIGQFNKAGLYADSCLQLYNTLVDYNKLKSASSFPFPKFNAEVIYDSQLGNGSTLSNTRARIDTGLYRSYVANDLRKSLFFKAGTNGSHVFRGSYEGSGSLFSGIAVDEVYLIRAECYARGGNVALAMADLNKLLVNRFVAGTFVPYTATNGNDALAQILGERRKELLMRGVRWNDLKRLNREGAGITLVRNVNGQTYTLPPNDPRYAVAIPDDVILLTGMPQNPR